MTTRPTCASKLLLLHLSHVVPPQVGRSHALSVKTQAGALTQPLRQPGYMAITLQVVGMQATEGGMKEEKRQVARTDGGRERRNDVWLIKLYKMAWMRGRLLLSLLDTLTRCHLQGPELRHVVETGHRQSTDVVIVEGAEERKEPNPMH